MYNLIMGFLFIAIFLGRFFILKQNFLDDRLYLEILISMLYFELYSYKK